MEEAHLFILVHGLWGGANHLKTVEELIQQNVVDSSERIVTLRPRTSSLFKTYDGIEIIGHRMLLEVLEEMKRLNDEEGTKVTKISFVGYSLGGLVSRYIIGELEKLGLFDVVQPMFFATFASPHLGVWFFKKRFQPLNFLASYFIGKAGSELFVKDDQKMLVQLCEGDYYSGLKKFKKRACFANIRHDRTVNFFTSYITDKNPFDAHWDNLDLSFEFDEDLIPTYKVRGLTVHPKIVNFEKSKLHTDGYQREPVPWWKEMRYVGIMVLVSVILPLWIPIIFTASSIGSLVSYFIVKTYKKATPDELKKLITMEVESKKEIMKDRTSSDSGSTFRERLDEATSEAFENAINMGQYDSHTESARDRQQDTKKSVFTIVSSKTKQLMEHINIFKSPQVDDYEIFKATDALALDDSRKYVMERLNALEWHKFAVYVNVLNAHDGIVARKGLQRSTVKGVATVAFFSELVNEWVKEAD